MYSETAAAPNLISDQYIELQPIEPEHDRLTDIALALHDGNFVNYLSREDRNDFPSATPISVGSLIDFDKLKKIDNTDLSRACGFVATAFADSLQELKLSSGNQLDFIAGSSSNYLAEVVSWQLGVSALAISPRIHCLNHEISGYSIPSQNLKGKVACLYDALHEKSFRALQRRLEDPLYGGGNAQLTTAAVLVDMEEGGGALRKEGIHIASVIGLSSLTMILLKHGKITYENAKSVQGYYASLVMRNIVPKIPDALNKSVLISPKSLPMVNEAVSA